MSPGRYVFCVGLFVILMCTTECVGYSSIDTYSTQQNDIWALVSISIIASRSSD